MSASIPVALAGYQAGTSILSRSLEALAIELGHATVSGDQAFDTLVDTDVTVAGETARSLFDSVESGRRQITYLASGYLSARVPELALLDVPFSIRDRERALAALDAEVGAFLSDAIARRTGLRILGFWDNGFRHLSNRVRPLRTPPDCRGLKLRTLDSADYRATFEALGFDAVSIDVRDLRQAVAEGRVDAQENPLTNFLQFELWRHHRHLSLTGHFFGVLLLVCQAGWFDALTPQLRSHLVSSSAIVTRLQRRLAALEDERAIEVLRANAIEITGPGEIDLPAMIRSCAALRRRQLALLPQAITSHYLQNE